MHSIRTRIVAPLTVELRTTAGNPGLTTSFFDVPWELIHDFGFWTVHTDIRMNVLRRIGSPEPDKRRPPSQNRLQVVFMAASPLGQDVLQYEAEEAAILQSHPGEDRCRPDCGGNRQPAVADGPDRIGKSQPRFGRAAPIPVDVLHLSCHGRSTPQPRLALETDTGELEHANARIWRECWTVAGRRCCSCRPAKLAATPGDAPPGVTDSLAVDLLSRGATAVLGWSGKVKDEAATQFARELYRRLAPIRRSGIRHRGGSSAFCWIPVTIQPAV
ncbi:MAG: hypothetical protein R3C49_05690 [Planctomycetaceae bacterium]